MLARQRQSVLVRQRWMAEALRIVSMNAERQRTGEMGGGTAGL